MNVTLVDNAIGEYPAFWAGHTFSATNTIVWDNTTTAEAMIMGPGPILVTYSDIEGGWTGEGNLDADPLFVDPIYGDYHLDAGSPCVDKGTLIGAPTHDIEGITRDAAPDMGVYEWVGYRTFLPLIQ